MECGKLTAKLRDAVPVCFIVNGMEVKRLKNIEIPDEIKKIPFTAFKFDVPLNGAITFKIMFEAGRTAGSLAGGSQAQAAQLQGSGTAFRHRCGSRRYRRSNQGAYAGKNHL